MYNFITGFFLGGIVGVAIMCILAVSTLDIPSPGQVALEIRQELKKSQPIKFFIGSLEFTKRADGSAVVRVKED